jgi:CRP-like cAMP-binding protein
MPKDSDSSNDSPSLHSFLPSEFKRSSVLTPYSDRLWHIQRGIVKTYTVNRDGVLTTLGYLTIDDYVGAPFSEVSPFKMLCLTDVVAQCVPIAVNAELLKSLISQLSMAQKLLTVQRHQRVQERLKHIFLLLSDKFGKDIEVGRVIELPLTHRDIADLIGASRVTVTKTVHALKAQRWLFQVQKNYALSPAARQDATVFESLSS